MIEAIRRTAAAPPNPLAGQVAQRVLELEANARGDPDRRTDGQRRILRGLARHFAHTSPAFARRLADAGMTADDNMMALPILSRREVQSAGDRLFSWAVPAHHLPLAENSSSGSTGEPVRVRRTMTTYREWLANTMRVHLWHGSDLGMRYAVMRALLPAAVEAPDWGSPADWFGRTGPLIAIPNAIDIADQARAIDAFRPDLLLSYPSTTVAMLDHDIRHPPAQLRSVGETLSPLDRAAIISRWGCTVVDIYSSEEVGYIALSCPDADAYHILGETLMVEILDDAGREVEPGQEGRVVVTDLLNWSTPLIRYEIGDRAVRGGACACGRTLPTLQRILGRERNLIWMPDGTRHWPVTGRDRYRDVAPVRQFQMAQVAPETIEARLVVDHPLSVDEEAALTAIMVDALGHRFAIDFRYYSDRLPLGGNGKLEEFVCLLS